MSGPASYHPSASRDVQGPPHPEHRDQQRETFEPSDNMTIEPEGTTELAALSRNSDRSTRFVYDALAAVVRSRLPIAGWDENNYKYIAVLARKLEDGSLPLSALVWEADWDLAAGGSREKALAAQAIIAHIDDEWKVAQASNDEDVEADVANDTACLSAIFGLEDRENPFAVVFDKSETGL